MYKIVLVDDEQIFLDEIKEILISYALEKDIEIDLKEYTDCSLIMSEDIVDSDIFILDTVIGNDNGISLASAIRKKNKKSIIMFVSAYPDYKDDAFHIKANAYIDKPIDKIRFYKNIEAVFNEADKLNCMIKARKHGKNVSININDVVYAVPGVLCTKLVTENENYDFGKSMKFTEEKLLEYDFFAKISGKCIVNLNYIYTNCKNDVVLKNNSLNIVLNKSARFKGSFNRKYLEFQENTYAKQ